MTFEPKDLLLAGAFAVFGFLATTTQFVTFLDGKNPLQGILVFYVVFFAALWVLSKLDLIIFGYKIGSFSRVFGLLLITVAFYLVTSWGSCYYNLALGHICPSGDMSQIYLQTTDGAVFWAWSKLVAPDSPWKLQTVRLLTYCLTPFLLALGGGLLLKGKPKLNP